MSPRIHLSRTRSIVAVLLIAAALTLPSHVLASLSLIRPTPESAATFFGHGNVSSDGFGGDAGAAGTLQAEVPAGSTVAQAYLYAAGAPFNAAVSSVSFETQSIAMTTLTSDASGTVTRADVTSIVSARVGSGGGITDFAVVQPANTQGVGLVVIYANPSEPERTIAVLDGGALPTGDSASFFFAEPLDTGIENFSATLALGITFGYQGPGHVCGGGQVSYVEVNGGRLTSCAGSYDDSGSFSGLITVGGVGDSMTNPPDPTGPGGEDDELYDLSPFLGQDDPSVTITTANPTNDDFIFLAVIAITAEAAVTGPGDPEPTPTPEPEPTPTPTPEPEPTPTPTPEPTSTPTPEPTPTSTLKVEPTPTSTPMPSSDPTGTPEGATNVPTLTLEQSVVAHDDRLDIRVIHMLPGASATFSLHSDPIRLGKARADSDGVIVTSFPVPDDADSGLHTLVAEGRNSAGEPVSLQAPVTIVVDADAVVPDTAVRTTNGLSASVYLGVLALVVSATSASAIRLRRLDEDE